MKIHALPLVVVVGLAGCMSQADMDASPYIASFTVQQPYQQVYANANRGLRACGTGGSARGQVDGQLYPDLGYGEITSSLGHEFGAFVSSSVRVSKAGTAAGRVDVKSAAKIKTNFPDWVKYWANGGTRCPALSFGEAAP